jgi:hypothetical protein
VLNKLKKKKKEKMKAQNIKKVQKPIFLKSGYNRLLAV